MAFESLSDEFIEGLISCRKHVENPKAREQVKPGHKQFNYNVQALDESGHQFMLYTRQNTEEGMDDDFSCGLLWLAANGECRTLNEALHCLIKECCIEGLRSGSTRANQIDLFT